MTRKEERKQMAKNTFPIEWWEFQRVSFIQSAEWPDKTMIAKSISKCASMLLDQLLRKKGLKGQFEEEFDNEYKKFKKAMEE